MSRSYPYRGRTDAQSGPPSATSIKGPRDFESQIDLTHSGGRSGPNARMGESSGRIVDLRSPEPQASSIVERYGYPALPNQQASTSVSVSHTGIKRQANDDMKDGEPKRIKGPHVDVSRLDPFAATINAAIEEYRDRDESEKRNLQERIIVLEAQLQKATRRKSDSEVPDGMFDKSLARLGEHCQSNKSPISLAEIDLLAVNNGLWNTIRDKQEELRYKNHLLAEKDERLHRKNNELRLKDAEIRTKAKQLRIYEDRLGIALDDSSNQQGGMRFNVESETTVAEEELQDCESASFKLLKKSNKRVRHLEREVESYGMLLSTKDERIQCLENEVGATQRKLRAEHVTQIRSLNEQNFNDAQARDKKIQDLENEVTETTRKLRSEHATHIKSLNDQNFNDRVMDQAKCQKELKQDRKELKECHRKLKSQESSKNVWKGRTNEMYAAYREVYDKNEKLVKKLEAVMTVGSFDSEMSAKNRKTLQKLKSCPVDELSAFHED